jgi:Putative DNA-binding domain
MQANDLTSYFLSIKSEDDLKRMITDHVKEDLYLEFKQKRDRSKAQLEDNDKFNFSRALSGFANSDGGILIWGVETYKKDESAKSLKPITDVDGFIRSLKSGLINFVQPFVDNVLIEKIPTDASDQIGFVKCLIPQSDKTPHRAMLAGREYYKRSTEGFYRLEHFDLEDMFGRRQKPLLMAQVTSGDFPGDDTEMKEVKFAFTNEGRWTAQHCGFLCQFDDNIELIGISGFEIRDLTELNNGAPTISYENNVNVIHPNGIARYLGGIRYKKKDKTKKIQGHITYYCQGMLARTMTIELE